MSNKKQQNQNNSKTPVFVALIMVAVSAITWVTFHFIMEAVLRKNCLGNPGCIILVPAEFASWFLPVLILAYGISLFAAYFYQKSISNNKNYRDEDVYSLAFKIFVIAGFLAAIIPYLLALL